MPSPVQTVKSSCRSRCRHLPLTRQQFDSTGTGATQLSIAYNADGRPHTAATETYTYDGFGKRVLIGVPSASTQDIFDPMSGRLLVENNAGAQPQRSYIYLNGMPIALVSGFSSINYVLSDQLGQPQKLVDGFSTLAWDRVADEFGATASQAKGLSTAISLRFPGQEYDAITGLHYNDQRDYDPTLGRYIQVDPIGLAGGINPYAYVSNNPINTSDPRGEFGWTGAVIGALTNAAIQAAQNFYRNGGDLSQALECINLTNVGVAALAGFAGPTLGNVLSSGFGWAVSGSSTFTQFAANSLVYTGVALPLKSAFDDWLPPYTLGSNCDCGGSGTHTF